MSIIDLCPGGFASACYLACKGEDAVLIDCSAEPTAVREALAKEKAALRAILCTHGHFDHILSADQMRKAFGVPLLIHENDADLLGDAHKNAYAVFFGQERVWQAPDKTFRHGEVLNFGLISLKVMHTPGHTRGGCVFLMDGGAFTGDTLFANGYGRTDLYGGDGAALRRSLQALSALPPDTRIYPGHGEDAMLRDALSLLF